MCSYETVSILVLDPTPVMFDIYANKAFYLSVNQMILNSDLIAEQCHQVSLLLGGLWDS